MKQTRILISRRAVVWHWFTQLITYRLSQRSIPRDRQRESHLESINFSKKQNIHSIIFYADKCPRIVTRAEWKARKPVSREPLPDSPTPYVVVHHGGISSYCQDRASCSAIVRSYQNYHLDGHGWSDIGYHFLVGEDGNVYEGRGWDAVGAHAPGYNGQGIGICMIGDFSGELYWRYFRFRGSVPVIFLLRRLIMPVLSVIGLWAFNLRITFVQCNKQEILR